jgi:hypothetical protein
MAGKRKREAGSGSAATSPETERDRRLDTIDARIEHLEKALEGLQDAVYRQAQLEDGNIAELRRRIVPERLARELSEDARKRGI